MAVTTPDVELVNVTKRFDDVVAVDAIDLEIRHGEFLSLLGPSGCGKTTTLRLIAGFEHPDGGEVRIGGRDVSALPPYRRDVNTVFQSYALFPHLTVLDNVAYGLKQRGLSRAERQKRAHEALELVQLPQLAARRPRQLSGGQQQRVALARALVMEPKVLLLDEPLGALDLKVRKELQIELKRIQSTVGITFVYVTHDQEEALAMSDRVAVMNAGRIEQLGAPRDIYDAPATHFVADFIGDTNFIVQDGKTYAVRPERIDISRNGGAAATAAAFRDSRGRGSARADSRAADSAALRGEIVTAMVIGPAMQCLVKTDDGQEVLVRQQRTSKAGADAPREGERVVLTWADDAALPLSIDPTGGSG